MISAYNRTYLPAARETLGAMLDYAVWDCNLDIDRFFDLFVVSGLADRFGHGDPKLVAGKSGVELAWDVFAHTNCAANRPKPRYNLNRSKAYWTGWALAHCQWATSIPFQSLTAHLPPSRFAALYSPYHERDERALVEKVISLYREAKPESNLKLQRQRSGLSQSRLAEASGVPLRTIQQYEQRQKDILKANVASVTALANVIGCKTEDILDFV